MMRTGAVRVRTRFWTTGAAAGGLLVAMLVATGCYRHVVKATGPGANRVETFEPNVPDQKPQGPRRVR